MNIDRSTIYICIGIVILMALSSAYDGGVMEPQPQVGVAIAPDGRIMPTTQLSSEQMRVQQEQGCAGCHEK